MRGWRASSSEELLRLPFSFWYKKRVRVFGVCQPDLRRHPDGLPEWKGATIMSKAMDNKKDDKKKPAKSKKEKKAEKKSKKETRGSWAVGIQFLSRAQGTFPAEVSLV
jgi:hypothetical protein